MNDEITSSATVRDYPFADFTAELSAELGQLVEQEPVSRVRLPSGDEAWLVTGYREVCQVLTDPRITRMVSRDGPRIGVSSMSPDAPKRSLFMDGPPHASLRRLASRAFTARRIEEIRPRVQQIADELVDAMIAAGSPADVVAGFAQPLPMRVISEVMGVPPEDRGKFSAWSDAVLSVTAHTPEQVRESMIALAGYLHGAAAAKRKEPGDDLLSQWVATQEQDEALTDGEIVDLAVSVLIAGHETTVNAIGTGLYVLFRNPGQLQGLLADPARLDSTIEETLRYGMASNLFRLMVTLEDVEVGNVRIPAGDAVMPLPFAANFDQRCFADPLRFDPDRPANQHLTFGIGAHFCLGAALARMELQVAFTTLLGRLPGLCPAQDLDELQWRTGLAVGGLKAMPVAWS